MISEKSDLKISFYLFNFDEYLKIISELHSK